VLKGATVLLLISPWGWAQESASRASAASVNETFSAFHQALCATASDLLASAPRRLGQTPSKLVPLSKESLTLATSAGVFEKEEQGNQRNQALTRLEVLRPILEQILREEKAADHPISYATDRTLNDAGHMSSCGP